MDQDEQEKARQKAYRLLALRSHSEWELAAKLRSCGFPESAITDALTRCRELGYLDDGRYARQRARELAVNRLLGDRRFAADLMAKGIPADLGREAIAAAREELGAAEAVDRLLTKKGAAKPEALDGRGREKLIRGLLGKGFPRGLVFQRLKSTKEDGVHDDDGE